MNKHEIFQDGFNPPIRVTEEDRYIHVSIDLPGLVEEQIRIDLEKTSFTVSVIENEKSLRKTIRIPCRARLFKKNFNSGILDIYLEKQVS